MDSDTVCTEKEWDRMGWDEIGEAFSGVGDEKAIYFLISVGLLIDGG
jgi:hypothetical protein